MPSSPRLRLVLMIAGLLLLMWLIPESRTKWPIITMVAAVPLLFGLVPRNPVYGFRTPTTCASDERWYPQNRITGVALLIFGVVQLVIALR
jgi:hypothetical protein